MRKKMTRREDYLKLIYTLSGKGEVRGADLADEHYLSPETYIALRQLLNERQKCV